MQYFLITCRLSGSPPLPVIVRLNEKRKLRHIEIARERDRIQKASLLETSKKLYFGMFDERLNNTSTRPRWPGGAFERIIGYSLITPVNARLCENRGTGNGPLQEKNEITIHKLKYTIPRRISP